MLPRPTILIVDPDSLRILDRTAGTSWRAGEDVIGTDLIDGVAHHERQAARQAMLGHAHQAYLGTSNVSVHRDRVGWTWLVNTSRDGQRIRLDATPLDTPPIWRVVVHSSHGDSLPVITTPHRHRATQVAHRINTGRLAEVGLEAEVIRLG